MELLNIPTDVQAEMYKLASINLSPNTTGQIAMGVMVNPPVLGDESYPLWTRERAAVLASLGRRAAAITEALNQLPGMCCISVRPCMLYVYALVFCFYFYRR